MERPNYLPKYLFKWEVFDVILGGQSALDARAFLGDFQTKEKASQFLTGYGFEWDDPILQAELFGNFQEALQFIRKFFLREHNPDGLDLNIPNVFFTLTSVNELLLLTHDKGRKRGMEEKLWAGIILKVMHTIIHADKDLRHNYFPVVQRQILDRFYKYIFRDKDNRLFIGKSDSDENRILLYDFQTKSKKARESIIIKLLHKAENVAEELFDRIGIRFVTFDKLDTLRLIKFLQENDVIVPHNIKPSRSQNTLVGLNDFRKQYNVLLKKSMRENLTEEQFLSGLNEELNRWQPEQFQPAKNTHSSNKYRTVQFTCRQLIKFKDPFLYEFSQIRKLAKEVQNQGEESEISKRILEMDISHTVRDVRFFYPFEVQITDLENHKINTEGEASHQEYKRSQMMAAMMRVFRPLIKYKNIRMPE